MCMASRSQLQVDLLLCLCWPAHHGVTVLIMMWCGRVYFNVADRCRRGQQCRSARDARQRRGATRQRHIAVVCSPRAGKLCERRGCSRERCAHEQRRSTDLRWAAPAAADCRGGSARATRRKKDGQRQKCVDEQSPRQLATVHGSSNDRASRPPRTANTILPSARGGSPASSVHARKPGLAAMRMHGRGNPSALKLACGWTRGQPEHRLANAQLYTQHSTGYSCACVSAQASPRVSPLLQRRTSR